ncbi:response regulator [candidate division KSB3 bacterium]|uniref:Response regulator n=1 Tax=candidate division KSB3 bacterium TaxID=2044937 RepID=A0A9D5JSQ5_9BACT|nr:response regulator [candidate division KSB3 bacterium]MBD3323553.1 response regulator [candidate division KSB3 bacterium]
MPEHLEIWGVKDPNISAQLALAAEMDLFTQEAGLDVTCRFAESGTTMPQDVLEAEQKPFAFTQTPITSILLHDQGLSTKILAPLADIAGTQQVIIHETSQISTPKDLEEKRIGMAKGAAVYIALTNMAKDYNVDLDLVYFINLLPTDQLAGFQEHRLDAIACWEPWTTEAVKAGGKFYFSGTRSEIPGMEGPVNWLTNQSCLIAPDAHIEQAPELLIAILRVLHKATTIIHDQFDEATQALSQFFERSQPDIAAIMRQNFYSMAMDSLFRIGVLSFRDFLYANGRVTLELSEDQLYRTDLLRQVDPSLVVLEREATEEVRFIEKDGVYYRENLTFEGDTSQLRFLMADDSKVVRNFLTQVIEFLGAEILGEATNGQQAIEMFRRLRPNFVTMDLSMPGFSGVEAIRSIRQIDPTANIIVISGIDVAEVREEVFNLGARMFVKKPFDPKTIADIIREMLD